jgi:hypothetical protein
MRRKFIVNALLTQADTNASIEVTYNGKSVGSGAITTVSTSEGQETPTSVSFNDDLHSTNSISIKNSSSSTGSVLIQGIVIERATVSTWQTAQIDGSTVTNTDNELHIVKDLAPGSTVTLNLDGLVTASFSKTIDGTVIAGVANTVQPI